MLNRLTPATAIAGLALFAAIGGTAAAADLIGAGDIGRGVVTSRHLRNGTIQIQDLSPSAVATLRTRGTAGPAGGDGATGAAGTNGTNGINGSAGPSGTSGAAGTAGTNGPNGANGPAGLNGTNGTNGTNGLDGTNGTNGTNGTIAPLSATAGLVAIPTSASSTVVVTLPVPAGHYVVLAKTQLSHTGAGDAVDCQLKAGSTVIDRVAMKTLPALAAIPASMQAVTTTITGTSPTTLSMECHVLTANGTADANSLIAIPTA